MCIDCINTRWESARVEKGHDALVKKSKVSTCGGIAMSEKDEQIEVEDARKEFDRELFGRNG